MCDELSKIVISLYFVKKYFSIEKIDESYKEEEEMGAIFVAYHNRELKNKKLVTQINLESNWKRNRLL